MGLTKVLSDIVKDLDVLGVKHSSAKFRCYMDNLFTFDLEIGRSEFSEIEPTLITITLICDDYIEDEMPVLDILNLQRISFLKYSISHETTVGEYKETRNISYVQDSHAQLN